MSGKSGPDIVENGLVLCLDAANKFSYPRTGTTWTDLSGNSNTGTLTNGPTFSVGNMGSIVFDGVDDYAACIGSLTVTAATFITWIRRNGSQVDYGGILFSRGTGSNVTGMNFFGGTNRLGYHWNASNYLWDSGLTLPDLTWCMIAVSVTGTSATAYLCQIGITSATNVVNHSSTVLDSIRIAADSQSPRFFRGNIAVAQIYNRALSATEVLQNYNATKSRFGR